MTEAGGDLDVVTVVYRREIAADDHGGTAPHRGDLAGSEGALPRPDQPA
jgi:hypothetical protein